MHWFVFVLLSLASYRAQRVVTTDDWPPSQWFRTQVGKRSRYLHEMFTCPWCFGTIVAVLATFFTNKYIYEMPIHWGLWAGAVAATVGFLADRVEADD